MAVSCSFNAIVSSPCSHDRRDQSKSVNEVPLLSCVKDIESLKSLWSFTEVTGHWTKRWICIKFVPRKYDAKICLLQSKPLANAVNAIFVTIFAHQCKYGTKYGIYGVCYSFALEQTYFCIIFALSKFDVNPCFRPVGEQGLSLLTAAIFTTQQDISNRTICPFHRSELRLVENAAENMQGKKQFPKFEMLQIEEGKHVYVIYTFYYIDTSVLWKIYHS